MLKVILQWRDRYIVYSGPCFLKVPVQLENMILNWRGSYCGEIGYSGISVGEVPKHAKRHSGEDTLGRTHILAASVLSALGATSYQSPSTSSMSSEDRTVWLKWCPY